MLWERSIARCGFRYTTVVSDGDSKAYEAVKEMNPYGIEIVKQECTNHCAKRLGKALLAIHKKKGMNGKGLGKLTKEKNCQTVWILCKCHQDK